jgi:hypothetical protein
MDLLAVEGQMVCTACIADPALQAWIRHRATERRCTFCERTGKHPIAISLQTLVPHMHACIRREYDFANNSLPYSSEDGGFQGSTWASYELFADQLELDLPHDHSGTLMDALSAGLGDDTWCPADPFGLTEHEHLTWSWEDFCRVIKHERRYFFQQSVASMTRASDDSPLAPGTLLERLARICRTRRLVRTVAAGTVLTRARHQPSGELFTTPADLGPPPAELALQANRMNPLGIPMMYLSDDATTAVAEIANAAGTYAVGEFRLDKPIRLLGFTQLPAVPSLFDVKRASQRSGLLFLHAFVDSITAPLPRDEDVHLEYFPSQVVTEFFRSSFRPGGQPIHGLCYPAARGTGRNYVLFITQADLVHSDESRAQLARFPSSADPGIGWVTLVRVSTTTRTCR